MRIILFSILAITACANSSAFEKRLALNLSEHIILIAEMHEFERDEHELFFCAPQILCLVDGYPVFGTEGAIPKVELKSLVLVVDGKSIPLEHRGMYNPWSPVEGKPVHASIAEDSPNGLRIRGEFSDGSATYVVEWLVRGEGSARVLIDCIECVSTTRSP